MAHLLGKYSCQYDNPNPRIEYGFWLVFGSDGSVSSSRMEPGVGRGQRAIKCTAVLPLALFETPELRATITVAAPVAGPILIDTVAAAEALKTALGVDVGIKVVS